MVWVCIRICFFYFYFIGGIVYIVYLRSFSIFGFYVGGEWFFIIINVILFRGSIVIYRDVISSFIFNVI